MKNHWREFALLLIVIPTTSIAQTGATRVGFFIGMDQVHTDLHPAWQSDQSHFPGFLEDIRRDYYPDYSSVVIQALIDLPISRSFSLGGRLGLTFSGTGPGFRPEIAVRPEYLFLESNSMRSYLISGLCVQWVHYKPQTIAGFEFGVVYGLAKLRQ